MIKLALLAPIDNSLYARSICTVLLRETGIQVSGISVRSHMNIKRFKSEFRRDGSRLIRKITEKLILGDQRFADASQPENLLIKADDIGVQYRSLQKLAHVHHIPYLRVKDHNEDKNIQFLKSMKPDLIIFTGGGIIRKAILETAKFGVLNCHSGILPYYRGMDVVEWTAAEKNYEAVGFGGSLHFMDTGVDTGPILLTNKIPIQKKDTFEKIRERIEVAMVDLMLLGVIGIRDHQIFPQAQDKNAGRQYFVIHPRIKKYAEENLSRHLSLNNPE